MHMCKLNTFISHHFLLFRFSSFIKRKLIEEKREENIAAWFTYGQAVVEFYKVNASTHIRQDFIKFQTLHFINISFAHFSSLKNFLMSILNGVVVLLM